MINLGDFLEVLNFYEKKEIIVADLTYDDTFTVNADTLKKYYSYYNISNASIFIDGTLTIEIKEE